MTKVVALSVWSGSLNKYFLRHKSMVLLSSTSKHIAIHLDDDSALTAFSQHCIIRLKQSLSDITHCFVLWSVWQLKLIQSLRCNHFWAKWCVCMSDLSLHSQPCHINQCRGLYAIPLIHSGFNESLLWDYKAIWCWVDYPVIVIITIILHHHGSNFVKYRW